MWVIFTTLIILILHEVQVPEDEFHSPDDDHPHHLPVQAVEGIPEEESHQAVCPSIRTKHIKNSQLGAAEPNPGKELKLKDGNIRIKIVT